MGIGSITRGTRLVEGDAEAAAWVLRRVGFGPSPENLARASTIGIDSFLNELFDPEAHGVAADPDPWDGVDLSMGDDGKRRLGPVIGAWIESFRRASRPVPEWLAWYWHGHLVSSAAVVIAPSSMVDQIQMYRSIGGGPFRDLLRGATVNPAMLRYLDGARSTGRSPNENYSRELLELFALGVGNYTEDDVAAGARALTGWTFDRRTLEARFRPRRHDPTPQFYLGADEVNDVDSVVDAVVGHPACAPFVAGRLAARICGPKSAEAAAITTQGAFIDDGLRVLPQVRRLVEAGLDGLNDPVVLAPIQWLVGALRATGVAVDSGGLLRYADLIQAMGQVPLMPPNVAGWPEGDYWFSASVTSARYSAAQMVAADASEDSPALLAANDSDLDGLASGLGLVGGYGPTTTDALTGTGARGRTLLALALSTPEALIA